jgi:uncharacterized membrane protein YjgN (DUF898 family)
MVDNARYGDHMRKFTIPIKTFSPGGIRKVVLLMLAQATVVAGQVAAAAAAVAVITIKFVK